MQHAMQQRKRHTAEEPLAALYRRFGPTIHRRARALLQDEQEALDVTQDTFLDYLRWQSSMRGEASPFTVLYQIATNKALDRLRRNARWSGVLGPLDIRQEEDDARPGQWVSANEGGMARVEALRDLSLLTESESPQAISAAVLYFVEGYTLQEVGKVLDLDRKAVSALLHQFAERARQRSVRLQPGERS
ncbi:RNA polymerase sigma-54 factor RpoN [Hyalangium minutum]|uniref:RNA polymerase sigma-54 factor RpoN n=2 Tax=Hyalangium minutum TaxID=394096 RepID=A0A085WJ88_9BACT|nr:RNA polymerase sigma-54 factor RpoN [Hyalangium minutum]